MAWIFLVCPPHVVTRSSQRRRGGGRFLPEFSATKLRDIAPREREEESGLNMARKIGLIWILLGAETFPTALLIRGPTSTVVRTVSMDARPRKRARASQPASYQDAIPLGDEFGIVYTQEHSNTLRPRPVERAVQPASDSWATLTSWSPPDDPTFALDPDCAWYDVALETHIMEDVGGQASPKKKKPRSMVSVSLSLRYSCQYAELCE